MIRDEQRLEVLRLLWTSNLTSQEIARRVGVSRTTVWAIGAGRREVRHRERSEEPELDDIVPPVPLAPACRCRGCGGMVHPPCRLCHIRSLPRMTSE